MGIFRQEVDTLGKERMLVTGGHSLEGQVRVSGGKNTAVAVIPATLLCDEPCTIENCLILKTSMRWPTSWRNSGPRWITSPGK